MQMGTNVDRKQGLRTHRADREKQAVKTTNKTYESKKT
jgi:hypothetical protein